MRNQYIFGELVKKNEKIYLGEILLVGHPKDAANKASWNLDKTQTHAAIAEFVVPATHSMTIHMELPMAAEDNLHQVIGYELDRHIPFSAQEVYFDFKHQIPPENQKLLSVQVAAAPRVLVDQVIARLRGLDIDLERVDVENLGGSTAGFNLIRSEKPCTSMSRWRIAAYALTALLVITAIYLPFKKIEKRSLELQIELAQVQKEAREASATRTEIESLAEAKKSMSAERNAKPAVIKTLNDLTRLLPDGVWLYQLQLNGRKISIHGYAPAAQGLIQLIEDSDNFVGANFESRLTREASSAVERFQLTLQTKAPVQ